MAEKKKLRIINPHTGFDSNDKNTYQNSSAASRQRETDEANERLKNRRAQNALSVRGSGLPLKSRANVGLSNLNNVNSFEEYARKRREQEEAEGMRSAAQKLSETYFPTSIAGMGRRSGTTKTAAGLFTPTGTALGGADRADNIDFITNKNAEREQREAARAEANNLANQYGYKNVAGKAVYVTPFSPLPDPNGERGASRAQAPGAYGISPEDYARDMSAIDRYLGMSAHEYDEETRTFLDRYFDGKAPTAEEFDEKYQSLYSDINVPDEEVSYFYHTGAELVGKATEQNDEYLKAQQDYNAAIGRLGEDAPKYATGREADYYERYLQTLGAMDVLNGADKLPEMTLFEAKTRIDAPFRALANNYDLHRWSQTTQNERDAYQLMRDMYGEAAAEEYLDSLKSELNQRLAASEGRLAAARAEKSPVMASIESIVTAPRRGIGAIGMGVERLLGEETDLYDPRLNLTREAEAIREETAGNLGSVGGFLYNTGMSMADNIANMALWGGLGNVATMVSMGGNSAASAFNDAVKRGADQKQATTAAVLSGIAEALFEKVSLDNVIELAKGGGLKNVVGNIVKQMGIEASEEFATGIANELSDRLVMGEKSNYENAVRQYMAEGMTAEDAQKQAYMDVAKEIGLGALGGALSGGVMGAGGQAIGSLQRRSEQRMLNEMKQAQAAEQPTQEPAPVEQPVVQTETPDVRDELMREYEPEAAQEAEQTANEPEAEEESTTKKEPVKTPEMPENGQALKTARTAMAHDDDGAEKQVRVVGVMMDEDTPVLVAENENGEPEYMTADELDFDDETGELLAYEGIQRMDTRALRNYLEGYSAEQGTAEEYASAYNSVYMRARGGVDYEQAALSNADARAHLTEDAMLDAYTAGLNAYNQEHDAGSAEIVSETAENETDASSYSIRDENGHKYVEVDTDQDVFDGLSGNAMLKKARDYIVEHFKGRYIGDGDASAYVSGRTAKEYSRPANRRMSEGAKQAKGRAAAELDNLLTVSRFLRHENDDGSHPEATGGWDYYETVFRLNGQEFTGIVNVLNGDGFRTLHDITGIKEKAGRYEGNAQTSSKQTTHESSKGAMAYGASTDQSRSGFPDGTQDAESTVRKNSIAQKTAKGKLSKQYTTEAWNGMSDQQRKNAISQMELMAAFASRTGWTIAVVDTIDANNGGKANASYDGKIIKVALDADEGAYAYAAVHELVHALKGKHNTEWPEFRDFVLSTLRDAGADVESMIQYQMQRFRYDRELAMEEVICNTVPAVLQDERNLLKLYKGSKTLFERVLDWMRGLLEDVRNAGQRLSARSKSWEQMDALAKDRHALQEIYDRMMAVMEKPAEASQTARNKESRTDDVRQLYKDVDLSKDGHVYDYDFLVMLPDMTVTELASEEEVKTDGKIIAKNVMELARENGAAIGRKEGESISVRNVYTGHTIRMTNKSLRHSIGRANYQNMLANARATAKAGELLKNALPINALYDTGDAAEGTYAMVAYMADPHGNSEHVAVLTVEQRSGDVVGMEVYDTLHSLNTRKRNAVDQTIQSKNSTTRSSISIAELLEVVKETHQSLLSEDVLEHFGLERNPDGFYARKVKFSMRDTDENVQEAMSAEQKAYAQVKGHRITAAEADKLAGDMLKEANSDYDRQKLAAELSRVFDYIERGEDVDWNQVDDELTTIMSRVMEKSKTLDLEHEEMAKPVRKYLRNTLIKLTQTQLEEARSAAGSFHEYRKSMFGRTKLSTVNGTPLDVAWQELHDMAPQMFDENASEGDMPMLLQQAVDALKPVYHTGKGMGMEESASWLTGKLHEAYLSLPAVKAAAKSAKTFGESVVELKNAMKRFEETSWSEYQNALRGIREARGAQQRTKQQEETAALRAKYVKWRERDTQARKEREMKAKYRVKIERTAGTLANWIAKPTDAKHVPAGVEDSVRRMLEVLDFSGKSTKTAKELCEKLETLASAMENAQEKEDGNQSMFLERDQQMIDQIRWTAEMIRGNTEHNTSEGRGVYELNGLELKELSKWLDVVKHVITEASKLRGSNLPGESVEQVAAMSMAEISRKKPWKDKKWVTTAWMEHFGPDMQDSFTFFERLGPTTNAIFRGLREGFDKVTQLTRQAEEHTKRIMEGVKLNELTGTKAKKQTFQVMGGTVELTKANIMELYVLSRREQAQGHIYGDGIRIQGDKDVRAKALTKADVAKIVGTLTDEEKRVAEGMQAFLSRECASWGNETSMKLLGYRKFGEEHYWPIRTDSNTRNTTKLEDNYAANISAIKNQGMTKATIEGAKNAIVIGDIFDTYTRHISNMAAYAGYALPLSDFTRWYNTRGVKTEIEQALGQKGLKYINNFLMAVNGSALQADQSGLERLAGSFTRNAKIASVGANARVVIQQPTSYARAAMYMSPKYLSKALAMRKPKEELVNRYCGIAQWKRWGFYETNIGPNLRQMIVGDETLANKARELAMKPAAWGDDWTLNHLWNACELETKELMPELAKGTEEYYQAVGKRMSEIIDRTQVVDSVFHRSQMMRSKNGMAQMLTNFMSEPTKTYNMLMSAISDYADNRKNKQARNRVARALTVYAVSGLLTAAAAAVIDAFRDEDAEKEWLEKYTGAVGSNAMDNLNPLGMLPGVKDVLSMLEGYEPSRLDTQSIQKIIWAAQEIKKYSEGESKQNLYGVTYKTAQALSSVLGLPVSNVMRDVNAVIQTVTGKSITKTPEARKASTVTYLYKALEEGSTARAQKLRTELREQAGMTEKEIDTALAEQMAEDPRTKEAYDAKMKKDFATMNKIINALTAMGFSRETVDKAILSHTPKEEKEKDPEAQLKVALYSAEEVAGAIKTLAGIEKGGSVTESDIRAMISDRAAASTAKDPEKSVISGIQTELKKDYLAMEQKGDTAGMKKLGMVMRNVLGTEQDTMDGWVRDQHADNLRTAVDGNNKTAALQAVTVMRRDGKTDSQIKSSLSKYKQLYIDAMKNGDRAGANRIKSLLMSLGLKGKNGKSLYDEDTFTDWLKEN